MKAAVVTPLWPARGEDEGAAACPTTAEDEHRLLCIGLVHDRERIGRVLLSSAYAAPTLLRPV